MQGSEDSKARKERIEEFKLQEEGNRHDRRRVTKILKKQRLKSRKAVCYG